MESIAQVIRVDEDSMTISARDLHEALGVETDFRHWFPRMTEYGFSEGSDFNPVKNVRVQSEGSRDVFEDLIRNRNAVDAGLDPAFKEGE